jgi:hypothetical protein
MKRSFEIMAHDEKGNGSSVSSQEPRQMGSQKRFVNKLVLFKPDHLDYLFNPQSGQYLVLDWNEPRREYNYCTALTKLLYNLGAILINKGYAYADPLELVVNGNLINIFQLKAKENLNQAGKLLQLYDNIPDYFYDPRNSSGQVENSSHALFVMRVALDHLPASFIYSLYSKLRPFELIIPFCGLTVQFPNGESVQTEHAIFWLLSQYILSNSSRFESTCNVKVTNLNDYVLRNIHFVYGTPVQTYHLGLTIFERKLLEELANQTLDEQYVPVDLTDVFDEPTLPIDIVDLFLVPTPPLRVPVVNNPQLAPANNLPAFPFFMPPNNQAAQLDSQPSVSTSSELEQTQQY